MGEPDVGWEILVDGLTKPEAEALMERVKSATVNVLQERFTDEQITIAVREKT
jgi:hypothetical protein